MKSIYGPFHRNEINLTDFSPEWNRFNGLFHRKDIDLTDYFTGMMNAVCRKNFEVQKLLTQHLFVLIDWLKIFGNLTFWGSIFAKKSMSEITGFAYMVGKSTHRNEEWPRQNLSNVNRDRAKGDQSLILTDDFQRNRLSECDILYGKLLVLSCRTNLNSVVMSKFFTVLELRVVRNVKF